VFYSVPFFALSGSKLTERIRLKTFGCLLRQEIAYYDRPENSSSAISVRLSSDASAIEQVVGIRLRIMCEVFALSCFGILFGMFFNWLLTMIVCLTILIIFVIAYLNVNLNIYLKKQSGPTLQRANTVSSDFHVRQNQHLTLILSFSLQFAVEVIHHIRTIKQLSAEKEVLRQYSHLIHQVFTSVSCILLKYRL
jgi:ABC-type multidrug transport system fused ATPase/permease subunit